MNLRLAAILSIGALGLGACGDDGSGDGSSGDSTSGTTGANDSTTTSNPPVTDGPEDSTGSTTDGGETEDDTGTTTGGVIEPDDIYESIAGGGFRPFDGYEARGRAHLVRTLEGQTVVELHIEGLDPDTDYPTHLHRFPCEVMDGGGHYQIEPGGPVDDVNEIWPAFTSDADGVGQASLTVDHRVRGDAQAVVVHDPNAGNARLACASLRFDPMRTVQKEGTFEPFAAAEAIDQDITGTATMEVSAGNTNVSIDVQGLDPAETYMAHVHEYPCDVADGGAHYQRMPGGPGTADNELWPLVEPDAGGMASDSLDAPHEARGDAQSVVIHRMTMMGNPRVACAPLVRSEYPSIHTTRGEATLLPGGVGTFDDLEVSVVMERELTGWTHATLEASGAPRGEYPVHVHHRTCGMGDGGGHYKIDPAIEDTVEDNELWLNFMAPAALEASIEVEHLARPEALSVVVHDPADSSNRIMCVDLRNQP